MAAFTSSVTHDGSTAQQVAVRTGTLVDATLIAWASIRHDEEARWAGHRSRKPVHGYKAYVATDVEGGLIRGVEVTTANVHDAAELDAVLPPEPGDVYGDSASSGSRSERIITARGGRPRTAQTAIWGGPDALARLQRQNAEVQRVTCPHRKGVRHSQAQLRSAAHALARFGTRRVCRSG